VQPGPQLLVLQGLGQILAESVKQALSPKRGVPRLGRRYIQRGEQKDEKQKAESSTHTEFLLQKSVQMKQV
jgi:hypothetical protein